MDFFDKLGKKASQTYKVTAEKTGKIAKETKMKIKIVELKAQITDLYEEIGEKIYLEHTKEKNTIKIKETIEKECNKLDEINNEIEELQKQCLKLQNRRKCFKCNFEIEKTVNYCPNCGAMQVEENIEDIELEEDENIQVEIEELEIVKKEEKKEKKEQKKENKAKEELAKTIEIESALDKKE